MRIGFVKRPPRFRGGLIAQSHETTSEVAVFVASETSGVSGGANTSSVKYADSSTLAARKNPPISGSPAAPVIANAVPATAVAARHNFNSLISLTSLQDQISLSRQ